MQKSLPNQRKFDGGIEWRNGAIFFSNRLYIVLMLEILPTPRDAELRFWPRQKQHRKMMII